MRFGFFGGRDGGKGRGWRRRRRKGCGCGHEDAGCGQGRHQGVDFSLNDVVPGTTCRILRLRGRGPIRQRLLDLGILPHREVTVVRAAPLSDPIELQVGDSYIVLRRREAAQVEVEHV